jgi:predicted transglutaminase-like cysteine proteinase
MRPHNFIFSFLFLLAFIAGAFIDSSAHAARTSYFDTNEKKSTNLKPFPKWTSMVARFETQGKRDDGDCGKATYHPCAVVQWKEMLAGLRDKPLKEKLKKINDWGNAHPYVLDQINWGVEDFWETPHEFMSINGDCEDYAIAKYYSLRALGMGDEQMRIMIVQDYNLGGIIHAILGVYDGDEIFILDNQIPQVMPASKIFHYRPIYGINESWWWVYSPKT